MTFKQKINVNKFNKKYYEAALASGHYFIRIFETNTIVRFIVTSTSNTYLVKNDRYSEGMF